MALKLVLDDAVEGGDASFNQTLMLLLQCTLYHVYIIDKLES